MTTSSAHNGVPAPQATRAGLWHLGLALAALTAAALGTYLLDDLVRFRPWVAGEAVPILRMFAGSGEQQLPGFAEAGLLGGQGGPGDDVAQALGAQVEAEVGGEPESEPSGSEAEAGTADAKVAPPAVRIRPEEYADLPQELEFSSSLGRFFTALTASAQQRPGAITRVAHYGDSAVAADAITRTARRHLQGRFGDAGHGFILISRGDMHYAHHDIRHRSSDGWDMLSLVRDPLRSGFYGYGGVQARGTRGQHALFATADDDARVGGSASRFELYFQRFKQGGRVRVQVDGMTHAMVDTAADERRDDFYRLDVRDGPHEFTVKATGGGGVRLYGAVLEREGPGVVYDSLGLVGARAERLLNADAAHMTTQLSHRGADLLVLGFGGNEASNEWLKLEAYERDLTRVVKRMRSADPGMDCLLFGPLDQGERNTRGRIVTIDVVPQIVAVQRKVAAAQGCAFFDTFGAMGGKNAVRRWHRSRPRLFSSDLRHATPRGYQLVGKLYYKALLKAFADHLAKQH